MTYRPLRVTSSLVLVLTLIAGCASGGGTTTDDAAGASEDAVDDPAAEALKIGSIVPQTGPLAFFGPPLTEAARLAASDINEAGGVLGVPMEDIEFADDAGDAAIASQAADRLLRSGVHAIVGAAGSGMSLAIIDKITGGEVVQCSPSNTAPSFTDYDDGGYYFRTAPSDGLQGPVLAEQMLEGGATKAAIVARADDYGQGLVASMTAALEAGGAEVVVSTLYDPETTNFDATVQQLVAGEPDAIAIVAFEEGVQLLQGMVEAGLSPPSVAIYGSDGIRMEDLARRVSPEDPQVLEGMRGTAGDPSANPEFIERLTAAAPSLSDTIYAAHTYDCTVIIALAAETAGSVDPKVFAPKVVDVTREGERCTSFADCVELIRGGADIDYDGASGPVDFVDVGEPGSATYEIWEFDASGTLNSVDTRESTLN